MLPLERPRKCPVDRCDELGIVHRFFDKVFRSGLLIPATAIGTSA